jgi:hypothetical protein
MQIPEIYQFHVPFSESHLQAVKMESVDIHMDRSLALKLTLYEIETSVLVVVFFGVSLVSHRLLART